MLDKQKKFNILLVGATAKDCGKTNLVCQIIKKFCNMEIIAIKVTILHGEKKHQSKYSIIEETQYNQENDTSRMLSSGAVKVYWIKTDSLNVNEALQELFKFIPGDSLIVAESNSLKKYIQTDFFIMLKNENLAIKDSANEVWELVDMFIDTEILKDRIIYTPNFVDIVDVYDNKWKVNDNS